MKNLIKDIKESIIDSSDFLKNLKEMSVDFARGYIAAIATNVEEIINQYNLITAPKQIKLSEIVERLNRFYIDEYAIYRDDTSHWTFIHRKDESYLYSIVEINHKGQIKEIGLDYLYDETKWLYVLWIAGTEIVDDLKEKE